MGRQPPAAFALATIAEFDGDAKPVCAAAPNQFKQRG